MQVSGKLVIIFIFVTALAGGVATLWFQYDARRRSREFWGAETAVLISRAPKVELLRLSPADEAGPDDELLEIEGVPLKIDQRRDVSKTRGLVHIRDALIRDTSFAWEKEREGCEPQWRFALRFEQDGKDVVVALDLPCERIRLVPGGQEASISPSAAGVENWLEEEFPDLMNDADLDDKTDNSPAASSADSTIDSTVPGVGSSGSLSEITSSRFARLPATCCQL